MSAFPTESGHYGARFACPLGAKKRHRALLFDHLVGGGQQGGWNGQAEHLGSR